MHPYRSDVIDLPECLVGHELSVRHHHRWPPGQAVALPLAPGNWRSKGGVMTSTLNAMGLYRQRPQIDSTGRPDGGTVSTPPAPRYPSTNVPSLIVWVEVCGLRRLLHAVDRGGAVLSNSSPRPSTKRRRPTGCNSGKRTSATAPASYPLRASRLCSAAPVSKSRGILRLVMRLRKRVLEPSVVSGTAILRGWNRSPRTSPDARP